MAYSKAWVIISFTGFLPSLYTGILSCLPIVSNWSIAAGRYISQATNKGFLEFFFLKKLASLATVSPSSRTGASAHITHQVHGGYETNASAFASNIQFFESSASMYLQSKKDGNIQQDDTQNYMNVTRLGNEALSRSASFKGTLTIKIGSRFELSNLIMTSITITPSVVEVFSPTSGERPKPLYYKITASFMTCRSALSTDVNSMFKE